MCNYAEIPPNERIKLKNYKAKLSEKFANENHQHSVMQNGFAHPKFPIIMNDIPNEIVGVSWGLIPTGTPTEDIKKLRKGTLNARIAELQQKKSYINNIQNRCLVIVNAFYEWHHNDDSTKVKHRIFLKDEEAFALGGIFSFWKIPGTDKYFRSFSILTTEANPFMAEIHNKDNKHRMPVILQPHLYQDFLNPNIPIMNFAEPLDESLMTSEVI